MSRALVYPRFLHSRVGEHRTIPLGYTILDNVITYSRTFYIVVDDPTSMPFRMLLRHRG